jgi:hypothetical protein
LPWLLRVEQVLLGQWEAVTDGRVHCIYCGSPNVARKSRQPRLKRYYDAAGQLQTVAVYRYYCHNPQCHKGTFTNLPPDLVPYSRYRTEVHFLATQMYAWGRSTYRRTAAALGVANLTVYRWVSAWGYELLPIAALFGVVKSSGVVGVDEKFVLVPKTCGERSRTNDKPAGDRRRWMYVYRIFDAQTKRIAEKRYAEVLAWREAYVTATPAARTIFDFLERHWPTLVNAIESDLIPRTNNAVELVIRRFDQHYQNPSAGSELALNAVKGQASAALKALRAPNATWASSRSSIALRPSRKACPEPAKGRPAWRPRQEPFATGGL